MKKSNDLGSPRLNEGEGGGACALSSEEREKKLSRCGKTAHVGTVRQSPLPLWPLSLVRARGAEIELYFNFFVPPPPVGTIVRMLGKRKTSRDPFSRAYFFARTTGDSSVARMRSKKLRTVAYCSTGIVAARIIRLRVKSSWLSFTS